MFSTRDKSKPVLPLQVNLGMAGIVLRIAQTRVEQAFLPAVSPTFLSANSWH
jgi:hypothetical protein